MREAEKVRVLLIIPAYNEEANIQRVIGRVREYRKTCPYQLDYVVINDGSTDSTARICRENGIHCVDLEPEEKDILTVYQYELRQKMPEDKRLTYVRVGRRRRKSCVYVSFPCFRAYDGGIGAADPVWHCG